MANPNGGPPHTLFQKGVANGRPKGSRSKLNTVDICAELGFVWQRFAISRILDEKLPQASRDYALGLIADRHDPKLKAVEITSHGDSAAQVMINIMAGTVQQPATPVEPRQLSMDLPLYTLDDLNPEPVATHSQLDHQLDLNIPQHVHANHDFSPDETPDEDAPDI